MYLLGDRINEGAIRVAAGSGLILLGGTLFNEGVLDLIFGRLYELDLIVGSGVVLTRIIHERE